MEGCGSNPDATAVRRALPAAAAAPATAAGMRRAPSCTATVTRPTPPTREPHGGRPAGCIEGRHGVVL